MSKSYVKLSVCKSTMEFVEDCKKIFLQYHPEFEHIKITQDKIIYELARWYMSTEIGDINVKKSFNKQIRNKT